MKGNFTIGFLLAGLFAGIPALAADSILDGPRPGPCAAALEGPDYVPGTDASGRPVPRADLGAEHVSIPDQVFVPLPNRGPSRGGRSGRAGLPTQGPYAAIDGRRLAPLINPQPCAAPTGRAAGAPPRRR